MPEANSSSPSFVVPMWVSPGTLACSRRTSVARALGRALQRPQRARAEVAVDVAAAELGQRRAGVDDAAGHRAALGMRVLRRRARRARRPRRASWPLMRVGALEGAPAEVLRRLVGLEQHAVDLLDLVLADVADPQLAERRVEREAPGVAQPGQHDVPARLRLVARRRRGSCRACSSGSWAVRRGSNAPPPSPRPEVEPPVGAEQRAGRRCGSPRAGRRRAARAAARARSCRRRRARNSATRVSPFGSDQCR